MRLVLDHPELVHHHLENFELMANLFCPLARLIGTSAMSVIPVILTFW